MSDRPCTYISWPHTVEVKDSFFFAVSPAQYKPSAPGKEGAMVVDKPIEKVEELRAAHKQKGLSLTAGRVSR